MKKIILLPLLAVAGILGMTGIVFADSTTLFISPSSLNSKVGADFSASVKINAAGNEVCVVEGTLNFDNLACQSITVADGLMAQKEPTCDSPSFLLGIPKCTTAIQNILSVSAKGVRAGRAGISVDDAGVIGVGEDVAFALQGGTYNIIGPRENDFADKTEAGSLISSGQFWPLLVIFIVFCLGYGILHLLRKEKK